MNNKNYDDYNGELIILTKKLSYSKFLNNHYRDLLLFILTKSFKNNTRKISLSKDEIILYSGLSKNIRPSDLNRFINSFFKENQNIKLIIDDGQQDSSIKILDKKIKHINNIDFVITKEVFDLEKDDKHIYFKASEVFSLSRPEQSLYFYLMTGSENKNISIQKLREVLNVSLKTSPSILRYRYLNPITIKLKNSLISNLEYTQTLKSEQTVFHFNWKNNKI